MRLIGFFKSKSLSMNAIYTILDQATISIINFLMGIIFIYYSTPSEYGIYVFFMSFFNFFNSVQNATINTPVLVLSPRLNSIESVNFKKGIFGLLFPFYLLVIFSTTSISYFMNITSDNHIVSYLIISISICLLLIRDFFRTQEYADMKPKRAFTRDISYTILALIFIVLLILGNMVTARNIYLINGIATIIVIFGVLYNYKDQFLFNKFLKESLNRSWKYSKWSLLGAISSWVKSDSYVYIPFLLLGAKELAFVAAARLLMTPMNLLIRSWSNYYRPLISKMMHERKVNKALKLIVTGIIIIFIVLILYTTLLLLLLKLLPVRYIPDEYVGIGIYVVLWNVIIAIQIVQSNFSSFLQASLEFKQLAIQGFFTAIVTIILSIVTVYLYGNIGSLISLMIGELLVMILLGIQIKRFVSRLKLNANYTG